MRNPPVTRSIEENIIISSAIIMAITILPFSFYRFLNEQYLVAFLEFVSVFIMAGMGAFVWKTQKTKVMSIATSIFMLSGLVAFNYMLGTSILFWIYPIIMIIFFLNSLKMSILLVLPAMLALLPLLFKQKSTVELISIIVTMIICQLFGYLLSRKIRLQYASLEELINQDGLTGALNRRAFDDRVEFLHELALRHQKKNEAVASLVLFDIDNFKATNDKFGHQEGDQILINLTQLVKSNIRGIDQLYRYGGEEFAIIAIGGDVLKATELAEKIRQTLESSNISKSKVTASFGVAELHRLEPTHRWIDRADKALYRAKRAGKNRVFVANYNHHEESKRVLKTAHG